MISILATSCHEIEFILDEDFDGDGHIGTPTYTFKLPNSSNGNISFKSKQNEYLGRINVYTYDGAKAITIYELYRTGYDKYAVKPLYPLHDNNNNSLFKVIRTTNNSLFKYTFSTGWGWYYFNL